MTTETSASITTKQDFKDTPSGKYKYWAEELKTSITAREKWWKKAYKIVDRFTGGNSGKSNEAKENNGGFDLNLVHSNTKSLGDML